MTAEIAICNRSGIALAADSAVTIGSGSGKERVWKHANKLFSLGPHNDIGLMIHNSGDIIGFPWEVVIKEFKKFIGRKIFKTVQDCAETFFIYIESENIKLNNSFDPINSLVVYSTILDTVRFFKIKKDSIREKGKITSVFKKHYKIEIDKLNKIPEIECKFDKKTFEDKFLENLKSFASAEFGFELSKKCIEMILDLSLQRLNRMWESGRHSGLVFAGFGKDELNPVVINYTIDGKYNSRFRFWKNFTEDFNKNDGLMAQIFPFAQGDMVQSFVEGVTAENLKYLSKSIFELLEKKSQKLINDYVLDNDSKIVEESMHRADNKQMIKLFVEEFETYREREFVQPILEVVRSLPKEEMAGMAEALVEITALKRKVDSDIESVGGPIDVAVISKGDGFIWIKRKHYFNIDLNRDFLYRKEREVKGGEHD